MQFGEEASALFLKSNKLFFNEASLNGPKERRKVVYQKKLILAFE